MVIRKYLFISIIIAIIFSINNCKDTSNTSYYGIPVTPVSLNINMDLPSYQNLTLVNGYVIFANEGYKGIIVYHSISGEYIAYDRACTYKPTDACSLITPDQSGTFLRCGHYEGTNFVACCASQFSMDGNVLKAPAAYPLKRYTVTQTGNTLTVTN
jgi:Rieske Fe-S protein